jgi:hypothetical protein
MQWGRAGELRGRGRDMSWWRSAKLRAGDLVEIRSAAEIVATLDEGGALEGLPFMPEMLPYCGRRFRVFKRAHKSCDTSHKTGNRRLKRAVHLIALRCDGSAHRLSGGLPALLEGGMAGAPRRGGCRRGHCPNPAGATGSPESRDPREPGPTSDAPAYRCQATERYAATRPIHRWVLTHYLEDLTSGNVGILEFLRVVLIALLNWLQELRGGGGFPRFSTGQLRGRTPAVQLGLRPGDQVEVRSAQEISSTLDTGNRNRGLFFFDLEMLPYCGQRRRVARRVGRIIDERTGCITELQNDCTVLEDVVYRAHYSRGRLFCPRAITPHWREVWLRAVEPRVQTRPRIHRGSDQRTIRISSPRSVRPRLREARPSSTRSLARERQLSGLVAMVLR